MGERVTVEGTVENVIFHNEENGYTVLLLTVEGEEEPVTCLLYTSIEKDASTNEEIDRLRLSATCALLERRDVIVVASVSCIYGPVSYTHLDVYKRQTSAPRKRGCRRAT